MKLIGVILKFSYIIGIVLVVLGFFLIPFIIGIPIFVFGMLLLIFHLHKMLIDTFVPKFVQEKIGKEITGSYKPYQQALLSMKSEGINILKISIVIFVVVVCFMLGFGIYLMGSREKPCSTCLKSKSEDVLQNTASENIVPFPQEEDIVRNFFALIEEKRIGDALQMMQGDALQKQAWADQFYAINSVAIKNIEPYMSESWTNKKQVYKLNLYVSMSRDSANAKIPFYGWNVGENVRWVVLVKDNDLWRIQGIATGP